MSCSHRGARPSSGLPPATAILFIAASARRGGQIIPLWTAFCRDGGKGADAFSLAHVAAIGSSMALLCARVDGMRRVAGAVAPCAMFVLP